ncbi:hypothetical protein L21SP4_00674 [Kiritimatiella glycovorans]|uniref:Uncharacterized protein n=1 Tax=Kiritimatiella glycovorans TaxID=1307763 RepID=A0A0G3ECC2_9BACT|nr:hypothetical protein L21SP4_00674 [Kiritimatiella glycovorans]
MRHSDPPAMIGRGLSRRDRTMQKVEDTEPYPNSFSK